MDLHPAIKNTHVVTLKQSPLANTEVASVAKFLSRYQSCASCAFKSFIVMNFANHKFRATPAPLASSEYLGSYGKFLSHSTEISPWLYQYLTYSQAKGVNICISESAGLIALAYLT